MTSAATHPVRQSFFLFLFFSILLFFSFLVKSQRASGIDCCYWETEGNAVTMPELCSRRSRRGEFNARNMQNHESALILNCIIKTRTRYERRQRRNENRTELHQKTPSPNQLLREFCVFKHFFSYFFRLVHYTFWLNPAQLVDQSIFSLFPSAC